LFAKGDKASENASAELERMQKQLYEKIGKLTVERDFLKKAGKNFQGMATTINRNRT